MKTYPVISAKETETPVAPDVTLPDEVFVRAVNRVLHLDRNDPLHLTSVHLLEAFGCVVDYT